MELCTVDLSEALRYTTQRLDEALVKGLLLQLLEGVSACHNAGQTPICFEYDYELLKDSTREALVLWLMFSQRVPF